MEANLEQLEEMQKELFRQQCDLDIQKAMVKHFIRKEKEKQLTLTDVGSCQFEAYATFCIECDRKGMKPLKYRDYLKIG